MGPARWSIARRGVRGIALLLMIGAGSAEAKDAAVHNVEQQALSGEIDGQWRQNFGLANR
jgi:hypothetical protein